MRKWIVPAATIVGIVAVLVGLVYCLYVTVRMGYERSVHAKRPVECAPEELILDLEIAFDINIPEDIGDIKTAKAPPDEGAVVFIVKFSAEADTVRRFVASLPRAGELPGYEQESDTRAASIFPMPNWFTEPIRRGRMRSISTSGALGRLYIDTTLWERFIVYFHGFYSESLSELERQREIEAR